MNRRKRFDAAAPVVVATTPISEDEGSAVVNVGANPSGNKRIDLSKWLNHGIDDWVWACASQLRAFLQGQGVTPASVVHYGRVGVPYFFQFLTGNTTPFRPAELDLRRMEQFVGWLHEQSQLGKVSKKNAYDATKSVLVGLVARGVISGDRPLFPPNPFPNSNASMQGERPLSMTERARLAEALRNDLVAIHKGNYIGTEGEALTVHALVLAMRTGLNPTPLLELRRDSLKPHPFMPNMMRLESFKRRGNATHLKNLRFTRSEAASKSVPMDGVAVFKKVLEQTQVVADRAPKHLRDRLWLYLAQGIHYKGRLTTLTANMFQKNTQGIVGRHDLRADDGTRLRLNASRLRKTMENRLWLLSNGDLFTVAAIMGHMPDTADNHYLACTDEMRKNATFVGEALPDIYRGDAAGNEAGDHKVMSIHKLENTPVGSCKDSLYGDRAPKDGTHCSDFFSCFCCRSYAIVGSKKDLHRLFSFYWFLDVERQRSRSRLWAEKFVATMNLIDTFTQDSFDLVRVAEAKELARVEPRSFWKNYQIQEARSV